MAVIAQGQLKVARTPDVRFGSKADIQRRLSDVRFTPQRDIDRFHWTVRLAPLSQVAPLRTPSWNRLTARAVGIWKTKQS